MPNPTPRRAPIERSAKLSYVRNRGRASKKKRNTGKIKLYGGVFLLVLVWVGAAVLVRRTAPTANTGRDRFDALIVLGTPADGNGHPTAKQLAAVNEAVREYERGAAPRIIFTGGAVRNRFAEAEVMAKAAESEGIPPSAVLIENRARNTVQNACFATQMLRRHGGNSSEIIGLRSHMPRTALIFRALPIDWRVQAAEALAPPSPLDTAIYETLETMKTMRYLVSARLTEECHL